MLPFRFKRKYYCLVASLQDIALDAHKLVYHQQAFQEVLKEELHPADYALIRDLFLPHDNRNLLTLLQKTDREWREKGHFSREELEENIREPATLPQYMQRFILAFKNKEPLIPGMSPENELTTLFYECMLQHENPFMREWHRFELNLRNIATAFNAKKHKIPYEDQVIGTDEVSETIRKSHARDFGLGNELDYLEELLNLLRNEDIQEREKAIDQLVWNYLDEAVFFEYFTVERVIAFTIKLGLAERWLGMDKAHGQKLFKALLQELKDAYRLPETFTEK